MTPSAKSFLPTLEAGAQSKKPSLFQKCLAASLAGHALIFLSLGRTPRSGPSATSPVEIDLTQPFSSGPAKLAAPARKAPIITPKAAIKTPIPTLTPAIVTPTPPAHETPPVAELGKAAVPISGTIQAQPGGPIATAPGGTSDGAGIGRRPDGSGAGAAEGSPDGEGFGGPRILRWPKLLNRDEVLKNLRRFYPEAERRAGREGSVVAAVHIGSDGAVASVDILQSAGQAFDQAAQSVGKLMRFSPAETERGPVPVKLKQQIQFQLQD